MSEHARTSELERLAYDALDDPDRARVLEHAGRCAECRAAFESFAAEREALEVALQPEVPAQGRAPSRQRRTHFWGIVTMAASLLVAAVVLWSIVTPQGAQSPSPAAQDEGRIRELVARLSADDVGERDRASEDLKRMGPRVIPALNREIEATSDAEAKSRLKTIIDYLSRPALELVQELKWDLDQMPEMAAWSPDGKQLAIGAGTLLCIWDMQAWAVKVTSPERVTGLAYSPRGKLAVQRGGNVQFFEAATYHEAGSLETGYKGRGIAFIDDRTILISTMRPGGKAFVARLKDGAWALEDGPQLPAGRFAVSPDGVWLAVLGRSLAVDVIDTRGWQSSASLQGPEQRAPAGAPIGPMGAVFSRDSKHVVVSGWRGEMIAYEVGTWKQLSEWNLEYRVVIDVTADSRYVIAGGFDRALHAIGLKDGEEAARIDMPAEVMFVKASPVGDQILVGLGVMMSAGARFRGLAVYRLRQP